MFPVSACKPVHIDMALDKASACIVTCNTGPVEAITAWSDQWQSCT